MPRPLGTRRDPDTCCADCPLRGKQPNPVLSLIRSDSPVVVICEYPGPWETFHCQPLQGNAGQSAVAALSAQGIDAPSAICRIACYPNTQAKRTDSKLSKAAACCRERFLRDVERADPRGEKKYLLLGKHSANGWLGNYQWPLYSGGARNLSAQKLAREMVHENRMYVDHPRVPFWHKTVNQPQWLAAIARFGRYVRGEIPPRSPTPIVGVSEDALQALRGMGPVVGWDVETLGVDPLSARLTCIGFADTDKSVSVPWDDYSSARHGDVRGIGSYGELGAAIRTEVQKILTSVRTLVTQNGSYDLLAMERQGIPARNDFDTLHAYKTLWPEASAGLEVLARHLVPRLDHNWKTVHSGGKEDDLKGSDVWGNSDPRDLQAYNAMDAWATVSAHRSLEDELDVED